MVEYETSLKGLAIFEVKSWLGRNFLPTKPRLKKEKNYLNLGCGDNIIEGYINADFFYPLKFWKEDFLKKEWQLDLRYPLDCNDDIFDGIYTEHTLEHLYPTQVSRLLKELYRILKIGATIRITFPDISKYIDYYTNNKTNINLYEFDKRYKTKCSAIRHITQNCFHLMTWDFAELKQYLEIAGFKEIEKKSFRDSKDERLQIDLQEREWETLYVEAKK